MDNARVVRQINLYGFILCCFVFLEFYVCCDTEE
jgi:hypothetical protein